MNINDVRELLYARGGPYYNGVVTALGNFTREQGRPLTWSEFLFLREPCHDADDWEFHLRLLITYLDIFPPKWPQFLEFVYTSILPEARAEFYSTIFNGMLELMKPEGLASVTIPAMVLADLMAIIPPNHRRRFAPFFKHMTVIGSGMELERAFGWKTAMSFKCVDDGTKRTSCVRSWEEAESDKAALRAEHERNERRAEQQRRQAEKQREEAELLEAKEAAYRAAEQRRLAMHLATLPAEERAELMRFLRGQHVPERASLRVEEPIKATVLVVQDRVAEQAPRAKPDPIPGPLLSGGRLPADTPAEDGDRECVICMANVVRVVLSCGHLCLCIGCTLKLNDRTCPMCRTPATGAIVTF